MTDRTFPCARCHDKQVTHRLAYCKECKSISRKLLVMNIQDRKEREGECSRCFKPALPFLRYCEEHRNSVKASSKKQYRKANPEVKRVFRCSRCNEFGHFAKTCKAPRPEGLL